MRNRKDRLSQTEVSGRKLARLSRGSTSKGMGTCLVFLPYPPDEDSETLEREKRSLLVS